MDAELEPGSPLYLIQYGRLSADEKAMRETGPLRIVGTELRLLETRGAYYRVRAPDNQEGWIWSARVAALDPRVFFTVRNRTLTGYVIGGMYEDQSGGSTTELILVSSEGLGEMRLEIPSVLTIEIDGSSRAEIAMRDGGRFGGTLLRCWLIAGGARVHLDKAKSLVLERPRGLLTEG